MKLFKQLFTIAFLLSVIVSCNQKDAVPPAPASTGNELLKTGPYCGDSYYDLFDAAGNKLGTLNVFSSPHNVYIYVRDAVGGDVAVSSLSGSINGAAFSTNTVHPYWNFINQTDNGLSCDNIYAITATAVIGGVSASINIGEEYFLECCCWAEETAWAAGKRYNTKGNWATYVEYTGSSKTVDLLAGKNTKIGTVAFSAPSGGKVTITINLGGRYSFADVDENVKIQDYATAPSGNPAPGQFDWKFTGPYGAGLPNFSVEVPNNNFYGVHVDALLSEICDGE